MIQACYRYYALYFYDYCIAPPQIIGHYFPEGGDSWSKGCVREMRLFSE